MKPEQIRRTAAAVEGGDQKQRHLLEQRCRALPKSSAHKPCEIRIYRKEEMTEI